MMMALGVRTQRFMCTNGGRRWAGEPDCDDDDADDDECAALSPPSVRFSSMYCAK